jgi:hypothetical protein
MPNNPELGTPEHLRVAERFLALAEATDGAEGDSRAWSIVLEFYAAVHWVRAYIRKKNPNATIASHDDVRDFFERMPELRKVKKSYDLLKQSSQAVRYYGQFAWPTEDYRLTRTAVRQVRSWSAPQCKPA